MNVPYHDRRMHAAFRHIDPVFLHSRIATSDSLDRTLGCRIAAKVELENPIGSFKGRGTELFCATALSSGEAVVCASAGNFGLGMVRAASRRGNGCTVFVASGANSAKTEAMRRLGADINIAGSDFDAAKQAARSHAAAHGLRFVEDGAEPAIAEGAGTIALELLSAMQFDVIIVPLGNGALLTGIGTVLRHVAPHVEIVAVVAQNAPAMKRSLAAGYAIETENADTIADGIAVRAPIVSTLSELRACCNVVVAVSEEQIFQAMRLIHQHLHLIVEPAGAVGIAAVLSDPRRFVRRRAITVLTGGNIAPALRERVLRSCHS